MCELFGMSCAQPDRATRALPPFAEGYSERNPHGWGIAYYEGNEAKVIKRPGVASNDPGFQKAVEVARSKVILTHLRLTSKGVVCEENCHPFVRWSMGSAWTFAHNGTIHGIPTEPGRTDSEAALNEIVDQVEEYARLGPIRGTYPAVLHAVNTLFQRYGRAIELNFVLSDGAMLYVLNHYPGKPMFVLHREKDYGGALLVSTQKLTAENWVEIPADRLLVLNRGRVMVLSDPVRPGS